MMILPALAGALVGAVVQPLGCICARYLLKSRNMSLEVSRFELIAMCLILVCVGACIGLFAQTLPIACMLFALLLVADIAATTDYHQRVIPNELVLLLFVIRLLFGIPALLGFQSFPSFSLASCAVGCVICSVIFFLPALAGKKVGAGDLKFVAAMGFCLGFPYSLYALALMGILVAAYLLYGRSIPLAQRLKQLVPMAPFACAAMMAVLVVQISPLALI